MIPRAKMSALLIVLIIVMYTCQSLTCKLFSDSYPGDRTMSAPIFSIVSGITVAIASVLFSGFSFDPQPLTVLLGLCNAVALIGYNAFLIGASQRGPYSALMVFMISGGILIPTMVNAVFFSARPSLPQYIAVALILASVLLICRKEDEKIRPTPIFYVFCCGLFLCNGIFGTLLDLQQHLTGTQEKEEMLAFTYLFTAVAVLVFSAFRRREKLASDFRQSRKSLLFLILCACLTAVAANVLVLAISRVNITVLYTCENAGVLLLSALSSFVLFREKLSWINLCGIVLACVGVVLISAF